MTEKVRIPSRFENIGVRLFGRLTIGELVRLTILPIATAILAYPDINAYTPFIACGGLSVGAFWVGLRPHERFLDEHLYNALRKAYNVTINDDTIDAEVNGDYIDIGGRSAVAVIKVDPVNLDMKTGDEKAAVHRTLTELYSTINYPVKIHSRQRNLDLSSYKKHLQNRGIDSDVMREYIEKCRAVDYKTVSVTDHYITVKSTPSEASWLKNKVHRWLHRDDEELNQVSKAVASELDSRCSEIVDVIDTGDLSAERIEDPGKLSQFLRDHTVGVQDEYRKTVAVHELPSQTDLAWTKDLFQTSGQVDITQVIQPQNPALTTSKLQRYTEKLNAEIDSLRLRGHYGTNRLEGLLEDVQWMLDLLANREDQPVLYAAYITAHGDNKQILDNTYEQVCNRLNTQQIEYRTDLFLEDKARKATSPVHNDTWNHSQLMPASSAAAAFPFNTETVEQNRGVIYGEETGGNTPVLLNRFSWSSHSMARMGTVGSGKSYATKLEIIRSRLAIDDLQLIIVDPKKEYGHLVRRLGGNIQIIDGNTDVDDLGFDDRVIGFQVRERGQEENVDVLADTVQRIYSATSQHSRKTLVVVDEARILLNDDRGLRVLNDFVLEARDKNTAVTVVTQNASHFTHSRQGREILDNMPAKAFMKHERVPDSVVDYFDLSREEKQQHLQLKTGDESPYSEAIFKVSNRIDSKLQIRSTRSEHAIIEAGENG